MVALVEGGVEGVEELKDCRGGGFVLLEAMLVRRYDVVAGEKVRKASMHGVFEYLGERG